MPRLLMLAIKVALISLVVGGMYQWSMFVAAKEREPQRYFILNIVVTISTSCLIALLNRRNIVHAGKTFAFVVAGIVFALIFMEPLLHGSVHAVDGGSKQMMVVSVTIGACLGFVVSLFYSSRRQDPVRNNDSIDEREAKELQSWP